MTAVPLTLFPKITISSINCNSLNMSTLGSINHKLKVYGITKLASDIILLSDIRLCNAAGVSNTSAITDSFRINPYGSYRLISNSKMNKRGVGILLKNSIPFLVLREERDGEDNILGLRLSLEGSEFCILSVYGPNNVHPAFFTDLNAVIRRLGPSPFIIGGDWNCTVSTLNGELNHDTLHMRQSPNIRHSVLLNNLCRELEASDPFRVKFPNKIDFTYFPSDPLKKNRSRIDFFITSNCLTSQIKKCLISPNLQNKSFDHRGITICFKDPPRIIKQPTLSRALLRDPDLELVVKLAIADTYIIHSTELPQDETNNFKRSWSGLLLPST